MGEILTQFSDYFFCSYDAFLCQVISILSQEKNLDCLKCTLQILADFFHERLPSFPLLHLKSIEDLWNSLLHMLKIFQNHKIVKPTLSLLGILLEKSSPVNMPNYSKYFTEWVITLEEYCSTKNPTHYRKSVLDCMKRVNMLKNISR